MEILLRYLEFMKSKKHELVLLSATSLYTVAFSLYTLFRHWSYGTTAWDLGVFDQALWSTIHGRFFYVSFMPGNTPFAFHSQFILLLFVPIYYVFPCPETLLVLQAAILGIGALGAYLVAKEILKDKDLALAFSLSYLLYPPLHGINRFDFHPEILATPLIFFAFYYILKRNYKIAYSMSFLILLCKEDAAFAVFSLGLYIIGSKIRINFDKKPNVSFISTRKDLLWGLLFILSSVIYFYIAVFYLIPMFNPYGRFPHWQRFGASGLNIMAMISNIKYEIDRKFLYTFLLFAPILFLPLLDFVFLILAAPFFAEYILTTYHLHYIIGYQYTYALIPFIFIAAIRGLKKILPPLESASSAIKRWWMSYLVMISLISTLLYSPTPFGIFNDSMHFISVDESWHTPNIRTKTLDKIISLIPPNASVSTQNDILPHICHRFNVYLGYNEGVDYILVDTHSAWAYDPNWSPLPNGRFTGDVLERYGIVINVDGLFLLKENYSDNPLDPFSIGIVNGLKAEYFSNPNFMGEPVYSEYILRLDINWEANAPFITVPRNYFSVIIEGFIFTPIEGDYTFRLSSDDGSRLYIDGFLVINGTSSLPIRIENSTYLTKGYHKIRIEYTEYLGNAAIKLEWKMPHRKMYEVIPPENLFIQEPY